MRVVSADRRPPDDGALVEAAREGDAGARAALFDRHADELIALATRLVGSEVEADDIVQDAFVTALSKLGTLREPGAFGFWLKQIAVREAHRRFRRSRLLARLGFGRDDGLALDELPAQDLGADARAELASVSRVLERLPARERIAWMLRYVEGYELAEVAALCECSMATAKRRIASAHERVRAVVAVKEDGDA